VALAIVDVFAKFKKRGFIHLRNIEGLKIKKKQSRDPDHVPFQGNILPLGWDLP